MSELNRRARRELSKRQERVGKRSRSTLAGLSLIATTGLVSGMVPYLRPIPAYATGDCVLAVDGTTTALQINSAIDTAEDSVDCSSLTLTSDTDVTINLEAPLFFDELGSDDFGLIGAGAGDITLSANFDSEEPSNQAILNIYALDGDIYALDGANITIDNLSFTSSDGSESATGIFVIGEGDTSLTVRDSTFTNLVANSGLVNNSIPLAGGAITFFGYDSTTLIIQDSTFSSNQGYGLTEFGGAGAVGVFSDASTVYISNSTFTDNSSSDFSAAGAVSVYGVYHVDVRLYSDSAFTRNSGLSGAISAVLLADGNPEYSLSLLAQDTHFDYNVAGDSLAEGYGGAIGISAPPGTESQIRVEESNFSENESNWSGGDLYLYADSLDLYVRDSYFGYGSASQSGGSISLRAYDSNVAVKGSTFYENDAGDKGGGISVFSYNSNIYIDSTTFDYNSAANYGGALDIYVGNNVSFDMNGSSFSYNEADYGAAINTDLDFRNDSAGRSFLITDSEFRYNVATEEGGALYLSAAGTGVEFEISNSEFTSNTAGYSGGAIYVEQNNGSLTLSSSVFVGNHSTYSGGAVDLDDGSLLVEGSTFANNYVSGQDSSAGAIDMAIYYDSVIRNSTFVSNWGGNYSQAIDVFTPNDVTLSILSSTIWDSSENTSESFGQLYAYGLDLDIVIENSVIANSLGTPSVGLAEGFLSANYSFLTSVRDTWIDVEITDLDEFGVGNISGTDPGLAETLVTESDETTHLPVLIPLAGSPLINAGDPEFLSFGEGVPLEDQRGFDRIFEERLDIGAVEVQELSVQEVNRVTPPGYTGPIGLDVQPTSPANTTAIATGRNLGTVTEVTINGVATTFEIVGNEIRFAVPNLDAGTYRVGFLVPSNNVLLTSSLLVTAEAKPDKIVNAGSFKGYVAIYAKGYEGSRLSAKVGEDWIIVDSLDANYVRIVEPTRWLNHAIRVQIFIDRVFVRAIDIVTR